MLFIAASNAMGAISLVSFIPAYGPLKSSLFTEKYLKLIPFIWPFEAFCSILIACWIVQWKMWKVPGYATAFSQSVLSLALHLTSRSCVIRINFQFLIFIVESTTPTRNINYVFHAVILHCFLPPDTNCMTVLIVV